MPKVLFISTFQPGLVESIANPKSNTIKGWPAMFHTIDGFVREGWSIEWIILSEVDRDIPYNPALNVHFIKVPFLRYFLGLWRRRWCWRISGLFSLALNTIWTLPVASRIIRRNKPDLVYCFCETSILSGSILKMIFGVKVVNRILGAQSLCYGVWKKKNSLYFLFKNPEYFSQFVAPADLKIITNDGSSGDAIARRFKNFNKSKVIFTMNGVRLQKEVGNNNLKLKDNILRIGTFSRLDTWKGVDIIVNAIIELSRKNLDIKLIIVGGGVQERDLKKIIEENDISHRIEWHGWLKQTEVAERMNECDIVIVAHRYCNLPNTLWEAMSLGKCVISVEDPGAKGVLVHRENAFLLKQDFTIGDMASALEYLYYHPDEITRLGKNSRKWAENNLMSWEDRISYEINFIKKEILR